MSSISAMLIASECGGSRAETYRNLTVGGRLGYVSSNVKTSLNVPSSKGVSAGIRLPVTESGHVQLIQLIRATSESSLRNSRGPKMTAFHTKMLSGQGAPDTPLGGSLESALKSRIKRRRAVPDWACVAARRRQQAS